MTNIFDVATYILKSTGQITGIKLQKLAYYCQAWSLAWTGKPLFPEKIKAWANTPIIKELYDIHKETFSVDISSFQHLAKGVLSACEKETIGIVLKEYKEKSSQWLSDQIHSESPWKEARRGMPDTERGDKEITHFSMKEYYGKIT